MRWPVSSEHDQSRSQVSVREQASGHGAEAVEKLVELMRGENPALAKAAAEALIDRGFGKPSQEVGLVADVTAVVGIVERRIVWSDPSR